MGFITLYEKEAFDNVTLVNYREVGLLVVNGKQIGAINVRWKVWKPNLGLGSTMGSGHLQLSCLPFAHAQYGKCDFHDKYRYGKVWFCSMFVGCILFTISYFSSNMS